MYGVPYLITECLGTGLLLIRLKMCTDFPDGYLPEMARGASPVSVFQVHTTLPLEKTASNLPIGYLIR